MNIIRAVSASRSKRYFSVNGSLLLPLALKWRLVGLAASAILGALVLPCMSTGTVSAASLGLTIPDTLSLSVQADGQLHMQESDPIEVTADSGYTLSISSQDGDNTLKSGTNELPSLSAADGITESEFGSKELYNNTWGYKPSQWNGAGNIKFFSGPISEDTIGNTSGDSGDSVTDTYTITLGARVDTSLSTGSYTKTFIISVTPNGVDYTINYHDNGGSDGPGVVTGITATSEITIENKTPTREDYAFIGWCSVETTDENCNGQIYKPGESYPLPEGIYSLDLYAMWIQASPMQNWIGCGSLDVHQTAYLIDSRDNNVYRARKLQDGKCWMVDNLRLGGDKKITLTPDDSNVSANYTLNQSKSSGFDMSSAQDVYVDSEWGGYYTWMAATAGSGVSTAGQVAPQSICPKGWTLPTSSSSGEFGVLAQAYGNDATRLLDEEGPNFILAGYYNGGSPHDQNNEGYYWSSTSYGRFSSYSMEVNDTHVYPSDLDGSKNYGYAVRCVIGSSVFTYEITYDVKGGTDGPEPNPQAGTTTETSIMLSSTSPVKAGYEFKGWCAVDTDDGTCERRSYQPGDSYSLANGVKVTLYAMWAYVYQYEITYDLKGGTDGPEPNPQTGTTTETSIRLSSTSPVKEGYRFAGWCSVDTNDETCEGQTYNTGGHYPLANGAVVTLHAMWKDNSYNSYEITYDLKGGTDGPEPNPQFVPITETSTRLSSIIPVKEGYGFAGWCSVDTNDDTCNGQIYDPGAYYQLSESPHVTLYAMWAKRTCNIDGNEVAVIVDNRGKREERYKVQTLKDGKCWMMENLRLGDLWAIELTSSDTDLNGISSFQLPASNQSGFTTNNTAYVYYNSNSASYGAYYSWYAATAGTGTSSLDSGNATSSICPKGWRLPTGGPDGEFQALSSAYGNNNLLDELETPNFVLSGHIIEGYLFSDRTYGYYWSSTAASGDNAYAMYFGSSSADATRSYLKSYGKPIRCVRDQ